MSEERPEFREGFLQRWSRLKTHPEPQEDAPVARAPSVDPESEAPQLPRLEELTMESDFRGFFHPKVDEKLRRAALRKLFSDPHFNVMDGLDTYIDDYSKTEPIPAEMLAGLRQAQKILNWASGKEEEAEEIVEGTVRMPEETAAPKSADSPALASPQPAAVLPESIQERNSIPSENA
jgi:hypothetical protein